MSASVDIGADTGRSESLFPGEHDIPREHALPGPMIQREYLVGGELRRWDGPFEQVYSPVWVRGSNGRHAASGAAT